VNIYGIENKIVDKRVICYCMCVVVCESNSYIIYRMHIELATRRIYWNDEIGNLPNI